MAGNIFGEGPRGGIFGARVDPRALRRIEKAFAAAEERAQEPSRALYEAKHRRAQQGYEPPSEPGFFDYIASMGPSAMSGAQKMWAAAPGALEALWEDPLGSIDRVGRAGQAVTDAIVRAVPQPAVRFNDPRFDQVENAFDLAGTLTLGASAIPAEANALRTGLSYPLHHGSSRADLSVLEPSTRGPLGQGVYTSPAEMVARRYAGEEGKVYTLPKRERDIFLGHGHRTDEEWAGFKRDKERLIDAAESDKKQELSALLDRMWSGDGYPTFARISQMYGSDEAAQALFKRAGFEGISGQVDGPEVLLFGQQRVDEGPGFFRDIRPLKEDLYETADAAKPLASKMHLIYNPPSKSPRAFEVDYTGGARADAAGNLTHDIEGNPLTARFIAGRRRSGEPDTGLSPTDIRMLAEENLGAGVAVVPASAIGGDAGQLVMERVPETGAQTHRSIVVSSSLTPLKAERVTAHEVSHLIDELAGQVSTAGLSRELRQVYNTMTTGRERMRNLTGPQNIGYRGEDIHRELMAEAIRAYMHDPNYLKTVAPETAKAIRKAVNENPRLAQSIQFNVGGIPLPLSDGEPEEAQAAQRK